MYSLSLLGRFRHGQEDAVADDGEHDEVVEVLVGGDEDARSSDRVPRRENEERLGSGESVHVVLVEPLGNGAKRLKRRQPLLVKTKNGG